MKIQLNMILLRHAKFLREIKVAVVTDNWSQIFVESINNSFKFKQFNPNKKDDWFLPAAKSSMRWNPVEILRILQELWLSKMQSNRVNNRLENLKILTWKPP